MKILYFGMIATLVVFALASNANANASTSLFDDQFRLNDSICKNFLR